jgi:predicted phage tail protein
MPEKGERSIGQLVSELTLELRTLFRQEMQLFTAEMKEMMAKVAKDTIAIVAGGVLIYSAFLVLLAAMVIGLATFMPAWGAALLVAIAFMGIGLILVQKGRKDLTQMEKKPEQTTESLKETVQWAKSLRPRSSSPRRTSFASKSDIRKAI